MIFKKKTNEERLKRAAQAKIALDNPVIKDVIGEMRDICYYNITSSKRSQQEEREDLYYMLRTIEKFENILKQYVDDEKILEKELNPPKINLLKR